MKRADDPAGGRSVLEERLQQRQQQPRTSGRQQRPAAKPPRRRKRTRGGVLLLALGLLVFAGTLINQLYQIQIVAYSESAEKAAGQHYQKVTEQPERGLILDRNGIELAGTTYIYRIGITPKDVRSITKNIPRSEIIAEFSTILNLPLAEVEAAFAQTDAAYIQLKKEATKAENDALKAYRSKNSIGGVRVDAEPRRFYTNSTLAPQIIGYTNYTKDSLNNSNLSGQLGIELAFNTELTGQPGYTYVETDNYSRGVLPFSVPTNLRAKNGSNVVLNLDSTIQKIVQEELENAIKVYDITAGGSAIVMNPYTGAVLAMASYPWFDTREPTAAPPGKDPADWDTSRKEDIEYLSKEIWRNRAISDTYEPGSTLKAITAAIAFEENLTNESEMFNDAPFKESGWTISCSSRVGHGIESMQQAFYRSCNPIFAQLALRTGINRYYDYLRAFGFMDTTGIDLPGEGKGILHENPARIDLATVSYGESSTVTPLQLATSYCAIANGGNLVKPLIVKSLTDAAGNVTKEYPAETIRKVISETTANRVLELMEGVVLFGTGSGAYTEGYRVAGKTSTSTDDNGDHTISFGAIAPADNPEIVVLVVLSKPGDKRTSSSGAARTVGQIVNRTLEHLNVPRQFSEEDMTGLAKQYSVPEVNGLTMAEARKQLSTKGFIVEVGDPDIKDSTVIRSQYPEAGSKLHKKSIIVLYPESKPEPAFVAVPDFGGKTVNEAQRAAAESGLNVEFAAGCLGVVAAQDIPPTYESPNSLLNGSASNTGLPAVGNYNSGEANTGNTQSNGENKPEDNQNSNGDTGSKAESETGDNAGKLRRGSVVSLTFASPVEGGHAEGSQQAE